MLNRNILKLMALSLLMLALVSAATAGTISTVSPVSGPVGATVTITGTGFGASQGTSTVTFNGTSSGTASSWSDTGITVTVPSGATTGDVVVTVGGVASNGVTFMVTVPPSITSLSPSSGAVGTFLTITGGDFGASQGTSTVTANGTSAGTAANWNATSITITVPTGATTGNVVVTVGGLASNGISFTVTAVPSITSVSPASGTAGTQVTVAGSNFGSAQGTGVVWLGSTRGTVVSWSDTQVVATVAAGSASGAVRVQQGGAWSNEVAFPVANATVSSVSPATGAAGTTVTITGSGFGAAQGSGLVWLGSANGVVQSWSDTQIVAQVAGGPSSGTARVLQNGVWSNAVSFTVPGLQITSVDPASGTAGTSVTVTGTGFGATQGTGTVLLGSTAGTVVSWSDTEVVATVASTALTGVARIQQNGTWSNAVAFTVPVTDGHTLTPNMLNLVVGDTHLMQALDSNGQPVTGLTWASSDTSVVSLSAADPPVVTAVAAGRATITAGTASADVTVSAAALPVGTVLWSNAGNASGVSSIVPAVPSASGVADVFAIGYDGTVQAITSDGATAWTANVGQNADPVLPDFQGGVVAVDRSTGAGSIVKIDGTTGQTTSTYTPAGTSDLYPQIAVHTDGTVFAIQRNPDDETHSVIGIDSATGTQKFSVRLDDRLDRDYVSPVWTSGLIIAGDGYAYVPYAYQEVLGPGFTNCHDHLKVLRIDSNGAYTRMPIYDWAWGCSEVFGFGGYQITNAGTGVLFSWWADVPGMTITNGTSTSFVNGTVMPGQLDMVEPMLQAQDGSFVGTVVAGSEENPVQHMVAFDQGGGLRWSVPNYTPKIATADGGVIATNNDDISVMIFDSNGTATGQMASLPIQSWTGNTYRLGSIERLASVPTTLTVPPYWSVAATNPWGNGTSPLCHDARDQLIAEYANTVVLDSSYNWLPRSQWPRFTPNCFMLTRSAHSSAFTFAQINKPGPSTNPEFGWALIKSPLVAPASRGYGLDKWLELYGESRTITSGYRDPAQNGGASASRHMLGDAIDFQNVTHTVAELNRMNAAALNAGAGYVETGTVYCARTLACGHADWRYTDRNKYAKGLDDNGLASRRPSRRPRLCSNCIEVARRSKSSASDAPSPRTPLRTGNRAKAQIAER